MWGMCGMASGCVAGRSVGAELGRTPLELALRAANLRVLPETDERIPHRGLQHHEIASELLVGARRVKLAPLLVFILPLCESVLKRDTCDQEIHLRFGPLNSFTKA